MKKVLLNIVCFCIVPFRNALFRVQQQRVLYYDAAASAAAFSISGSVPPLVHAQLPELTDDKLLYIIQQRVSLFL
jgi:hypothetical protein